MKNGLGISLPVAAVADELPRLMSGERKIAIDTGYDLSPWMLEQVTDRLLGLLDGQLA